MQQQHLPPEQAAAVAAWNRPTSAVSDQATCEDEAVRAQPTGIAPLEHVLQRDTRRRLAAVMLLPFVPIIPIVILKALLSAESWIHLCTSPAFVMAALVISIGMPVTFLKPSRKARQAMRQLSTLENVSAIGGLLETLTFGLDVEIDAPARETLIRLLLQLKASDADLITERQMAVLRGTLGQPPVATGNLFTRLAHRKTAHARLQIAILKAFEQIGDSRSLPVVAQLAKHAADLRVRQAAQECLPFVQARADQERANQTLLRAASPLGPDPALLLRPAQEVAEHTPDEMLRPSATH